MSVTGYIGIVAAFCTTVAFVPQIVKLRKQGGKDLSYPMLFLYLVGVLLWLVYGVQVHAAAVVWANALTGVLVLVSIVLKANPPARKLDAGARRLRIAVDMDEVIADAFSKHLRQYNQRAGTNLTPKLVSEKGLGALIPVGQREEFNAIPIAMDFLPILSSLPAAGKRCWNCRESMTSTSPAPPWKSRVHSQTSSSGWKRISLLFRPAGLCFAGTKSIINADVLIDDRSRHFKGFRGAGILFTAPHNVGEAADLRANNWNDVLRNPGRRTTWKSRLRSVF